MSIYPLVVDPTLPAFDVIEMEGKAIEVPFKSPTSESILQTSTFEYVIRSQKTNEIMGQGNYKQSGTFVYKVLVKLNEGLAWEPNLTYKIQLRYTTSNGQTSEWSTVCYVKAIAPEEISLTILGEQAEETGKIFNNSPTFRGSFPVLGTEDQVSYWFRLERSGEIIEDTGWLKHNKQAGDFDLHVFQTAFTPGNVYTVFYGIETVNGYREDTKIEFQYYEILSAPITLTLEVNADDVEEEGYISVRIARKEDVDQQYIGSIVLRRSDDTSDYQKWEDYKIFNLMNVDVDIDFHDYLIENGRSYKYSIQAINSDGMRSPGIFTTPVRATFEHMFLVGNDRQLKIKFNPQVSSYKRQLQESKTETIGSQYPFIRRNGAVNYFTFPIAGLISYYVDEAAQFMDLCEIYPGLKDRVERATARREFSGTTNLTNDNILAERTFREEVEAFLTNGDYKYFKSPTESAKIVSITGVSLSPNTTVGRMLYTFSSTANEVMDCSLTNALNAGIITKGEQISKEEYINGKIEVTTGYFEEIKFTNKDMNYEVSDYITYLQEELVGDNIVIAIDALTNLIVEVVDEIPYDGLTIIVNGQEVLISPLTKLYDFSGIKVKDLKIPGGTTVQVRCNVTYHYISIENEEVKAEDYKTDFYQIAVATGEDNFDGDVIKAVALATGLKISHLSFLRLELAPGKWFTLNGERMVMNDTSYYEVTGNVYSLTIDDPAYVYVSMVYNGLSQTGQVR